MKMMRSVRQMMLKLRHGREMAGASAAAAASASATSAVSIHGGAAAVVAAVGVVVCRWRSWFGRHRVHSQDGGWSGRTGRRAAVTTVQIAPRRRSSVGGAVQRRAVKRLRARSSSSSV